MIELQVITKPELEARTIQVTEREFRVLGYVLDAVREGLKPTRLATEEYIFIWEELFFTSAEAYDLQTLDKKIQGVAS